MVPGRGTWQRDVIEARWHGKVENGDAADFGYRLANRNRSAIGALAGGDRSAPRACPRLRARPPRRRIRRRINITAVAGDGVTPLPFARFQVIDSNGELITTRETTPPDGVVSIDIDLTDPELTYTVTMETPPACAEISRTIRLSVRLPPAIRSTSLSRLPLRTIATWAGSPSIPTRARPVLT